MSALGLVHDSSLQRNQQRFLECFANSCNVLQASRWAKVDRTAHYRWMETDPTYPARFRATVKRATRTLEDEAVRRAREGVRKPVLYKGKQVYVEGSPVYDVVTSDQVLIFLLKAYDRERFGDKQEITQVWDGRMESLNDTQLEQIQQHFLQLAEAERKKQIEAGQTVDATAEVVEAKPVDEPTNG